MAKPLTAVVKLQVAAGQATPAPPVGTALGPHGVNIMEFVKQFNAKTAQAQGMITPVEVTIFKDRTFTFITKTPPAAVLLKKEAGIEKGSPTSNRQKVSKVTRARLRKIAELKMPDLNAKHADQVVRGTVSLPNGTGKKVRVLVIAQGDKAKEAEAAGADFVGVEYIQKIKDGWLDTDMIVATPDVMGQLGPLGKVLGPRGLMPNPKAGTVTMDVARAVKELKAGKIEFRVDKSGIVHAPIGKKSFSADALAENLQTFMEAIVRAKPAAAKGHYIRSVTVSSTMGPGVHLDPAVFA